MFDMAVQTNKTSSIKHENKRNVRFKLFDWMFDGPQIVLNKTKHNQTQSNSTKQSGQTVKCLITQHFLFGQAFSDHFLLNELKSKLVQA